MSRDAIKDLESLSLNQRIDSILQDISSGNLKYSRIDPLELARLLGVNLPPDNSWGFSKEYKIKSLNQYVEDLRDFYAEIEDDGSCMTLETTYDFLTNTVEKNSYLSECW